MTTNETQLLKKLIENPCADQCPSEAWTWTFNVLETPSDKGTFGALLDKGLVDSRDWDGEQVYMVTAAGMAANS